MTEEKISEMMRELFSKTVSKTYSSGGGKYTVNIIDKDYKIIVEQIIRGFLLENRDEQLGILQTKVFMYEQIISKSNFAPMLEKQLETIINEQEKAHNEK